MEASFREGSTDRVRAPVGEWPSEDDARQVAHRYRVVESMGGGATAEVFRALDRLTGEVVVLKELRGFRPASTAEHRYELVKEFEILTSLRHPHIVSVYEFGFDDDGTPFLTMALEEGCRPIVEAATGRTEAGRVDLLVQTLRALAYLHDCGVLHRDLSPNNVVVVGSHVKVLDFGFAVPRDVDETLATAGTLRYMAPELLDGCKPTVQSDLFALGLLALEILSGSYPFPGGDKYELFRFLRETRLPRPGELVGSPLREVIGRMLERDPAARFRSSEETIEAIGRALDVAIPFDTEATRESFLQAAPFVGRETEIETIEAARRRARDGGGSSWLIAGESGVGKSRLLGELRRRALVDGVLVVRGEARREGGRPYDVWRGVVRQLVLSCEPSAVASGVLKTLVPDIATLLGRVVPDLPRLDPEATQSRLFLAVGEILRAHRQPLMILLEDLQWAGSESLALLARVAEAIRSRRVVVIGTYRSEESPDLPSDIPAAQVLPLRRLNLSEMARLGESMIGPAAREPAVVDLLHRESEGIPFFLVEVVRELADRSGSRGGIGEKDLPSRVITGGIQRSIRRRLARVDAPTTRVLRTAAVVGRAIDRILIEAVHPELEFDSWARRCHRAALIDTEGNAWRFSHDKVREQLIDDLDAPERRRLHGAVAEVLERDPEAVSALAPRLAHHWGEAEDREKEARYSELAGRGALESGACREALRYLGRARDLVARLGAGNVEERPSRTRRGWRARLDPNGGVAVDTPRFRLGCIEGDLSEAHYRLGDLSACRRHAERALRHFGQHVPDSELDWRLAVIRQWLLRIAQMALRVRSRRDRETALVASAVARVQSKITDASFYSLSTVPLLWSSVRLINQCEPMGASSELARGYIILALLAGLSGLSSLERRFARRALEVAEQVGSDQDVAWVLSRTCVLYENTCRWAEFDVDMARAIALAAKVGDVKLLEECRAQAGAVDMYRGQYQSALETFEEIAAMGSRSGNRQVLCWVALGRGDCLHWLGRLREALQVYDEVLRDLDQEALKTEAIWAWGARARTLLRLGQREEALRSALLGLEFIRSSAPLGYWTRPGYVGTAEVFLRLWETEEATSAAGRRDVRQYADEACEGLASFAKRFTLGRPSHLICNGRRHWLRGQRRRAIRSWREAVSAATALDVPYECAEAHAELARRLDGVAAEFHRGEARRIVAMLGCAWPLPEPVAATKELWQIA